MSGSFSRGSGSSTGRPARSSGTIPARARSKMIMPMSADKDIVTEGGSEYVGDIYIDLATRWVRKATLDEFVVTETRLPATGRARPRGRQGPEDPGLHGPPPADADGQQGRVREIRRGRPARGEGAAPGGSVGVSSRRRRSAGEARRASAPLERSSSAVRNPQSAPAANMPAARAVAMSMDVSPTNAQAAGARPSSAAMARAGAGSGLSGTPGRAPRTMSKRWRGGAPRPSASRERLGLLERTAVLTPRRVSSARSSGMPA